MPDRIHQYLEHVASGTRGFLKSLQLSLSFERVLPLEPSQACQLGFLLLLGGPSKRDRSLLVFTGVGINKGVDADDRE